MNPSPANRDSRRIGELQKTLQQDEFRRAVRALLMQPLMTPEHEAYGAVRRQADRLREWFSREAGWPLQVDREGARLFKRPANTADDTRGLPAFDRRRYALLCLACAVLERADPQITLRLLGERVMQLAAEPALAEQGFNFTLSTATERRDLVAVCRLLLKLGILRSVAGDEDSFVRENNGGQSDVLYDIQRRLLSGMLAAVRGPSAWRAGEAPVDFGDRLRSLVNEFALDSEQSRRDAIRYHLARRLLDDPAVYTASLDADALAYFINQRGAMANRLCEGTGLVAEQRAEGLALADESGQLTDIAMPAEGTEAHATLLVAEYLARGLRDERTSSVTTEDRVVAFVRDAIVQYGRYWRKSARMPGAEKELAVIALDRLCQLQLIGREASAVRPLPAIARFALGQAEIRTSAGHSGNPDPATGENPL